MRSILNRSEIICLPTTWQGSEPMLQFYYEVSRPYQTHLSAAYRNEDLVSFSCHAKLLNSQFHVFQQFLDNSRHRDFPLCDMQAQVGFSCNMDIANQTPPP